MRPLPQLDAQRSNHCAITAQPKSVQDLGCTAHDELRGELMRAQIKKNSRVCKYFDDDTPSLRRLKQTSASASIHEHCSRSSCARPRASPARGTSVLQSAWKKVFFGLTPRRYVAKITEKVVFLEKMTGKKCSTFVWKKRWKKWFCRSPLDVM